MSTFRVASRYAKSILELSVEKGILEQVHKDMNKLISLANSSNEFSDVLKSPVISSDEKLKVLKSLFQKEANVLTISFFELVCKKGRASVLPAMAKEYHKQYNLHLGIQSAELTSTVKLDAQTLDALSDVVKEISGKQKVELIEKIDPNLIGGFILRVEDRQIDESIKSKLQQLKLDFTRNLYEKKY